MRGRTCFKIVGLRSDTIFELMLDSFRIVGVGFGTFVEFVLLDCFKIVDLGSGTIFELMLYSFIIVGL